MKKLISILAAVFLLSACGDAFQYHPYDVRLEGKLGINASNISRIEKATLGRDTIRFALISDTQGWFDDTEDEIAVINSRSDLDFVVHGGDVTDFGDTKEYLWQRDLLETLDIPYVVLIGNHDCLGTGKETYKKIFGPTVFSFIAARVKFVCINTNAMEYDYSEDIPDFTFLEEEWTADSADFDRTIVCMHAAPYTEQFNNNVAKPFEHYMYQFPGLMFCLCGHTHVLEVEDIFGDGLLYYTTACAHKRMFYVFTLTPDGYEYEIVEY